MDSLKLGLVGLPEAEANLIATLFRLHRVERSFIWTLKTAPPFDALLVDASLAEDAFQPQCAPNTSIMRLSAPGQQVEGEMQRPIRSDRLVSWLNSIEVGLLHGGHDAFASTASHSQMDSPPHSAAHAKSATQPLAAIETAVIDTSDASLVYKLKRWPPIAAMAKDVGRIRIATVLSRKPISLKELASLSRVESNLCETFLQTLAQHSLISIERRPIELPAIPLADALPNSKSSSSKKGLNGGLALIRSIRRRFGLL